MSSFMFFVVVVVVDVADAVAIVKGYQPENIGFYAVKPYK